MKLTIRSADGRLMKYSNQLGALGEGLAKRVMSDALNKACDIGRTQSKRALVRITGIKYGQINKAVTTTRSKPATLTYALTGRGAETNVNLFAAKQTKKGVRARPWNRSQLFEGTFIIKRYGNKVYRRLSHGSDKTYGKLADHEPEAGSKVSRALSGKKGFGRFPIKQVYGPNLARELDKGEPKQLFQASAQGELPRLIASQIARHLKV